VEIKGRLFWFAGGRYELDNREVDVTVIARVSCYYGYWIRGHLLLFDITVVTLPITEET
jgi:hypothetical protein